MIPNYNKNKLLFKKLLVTNSTFGEMKLWAKLRNKQMLGYKFRRQYIFAKFILDFYCIELQLAIEIDGMSHDESRFEKDMEREKYLTERGVTFLRFSEKEVKNYIVYVLTTIELKILELTKSTSP